MPKITALNQQVSNKNRVNVLIDGKYRFSVDISQVTGLQLKVGADYTEQELAQFETESQFGKLYVRALDYCLVRPRSVKEVNDYLWKKTLPKKYRTKTGDVKDRPGAPVDVTKRVLDKLIENNYVNDDVFVQWWLEYRNRTKGSSIRKLRAELLAKGISDTHISSALRDSDRDDTIEIKKIIKKKKNKYPDRQKFITYLARQGFKYDDIRDALDDSADNEC